MSPSSELIHSTKEVSGSEKSSVLFIIIKTTRIDLKMEAIVQHSPPGSKPVASWAAVIAAVVVVWHHLLHHSHHELCSLCHCRSHVIPLVLAVQVYVLTGKIFLQSH
jgi:hypothetical protein